MKDFYSFGRNKEHKKTTQSKELQSISCDFAIACVDGFGGIGRNGKLLTHNRDDMRFFREKTENSILVMGSKTYESLPNASDMMRKGNRIGIILTREKDMALPFEFIAMTKEEFRCPETFIQKLDSRFGNGKAILKYSTENIVLIGGAYYYNQLEELGIRKVYLTRLLGKEFNTYPSKADTFVDLGQQIFQEVPRTIFKNSEIKIEEYIQDNPL